MSLTKYTKQLAKAVTTPNGAVLQKLCTDIEYDQLGQEKWPQEVFTFLLDALRDPQVCSMKGSAAIITCLYNDFDKLTTEQHAALVNALDESADIFANEMLRHAASDLVARLYDVPLALGKFNKWMDAATRNRLHMAQVGFEVLMMAKRLNTTEYTKVRNHLQKLWQLGS